MDPIDYQSPPTGPVPPEQWEDAYGCFPAVLACVLGLLGTLAAGLAVAGFQGSERVGIAALGGVTLACGWASAVAAVRAPRGKWAGAAALVAASLLTVAVCCVAARALW